MGTGGECIPRGEGIFGEQRELLRHVRCSLHWDSVVAVYGASTEVEAIEEALFLTKIAKTVYWISNCEILGCGNVINFGLWVRCIAVRPASTSVSIRGGDKSESKGGRLR